MSAGLPGSLDAQFPRQPSGGTFTSGLGGLHHGVVGPPKTGRTFTENVLSSLTQKAQPTNGQVNGVSGGRSHRSGFVNSARRMDAMNCDNVVMEQDQAMRQGAPLGGGIHEEADGRRPS